MSAFIPFRLEKEVCVGLLDIRIQQQGFNPLSVQAQGEIHRHQGLTGDALASG
jgi:hypothetical protein